MDNIANTLISVQKPEVKLNLTGQLEFRRSKNKLEELLGELANDTAEFINVHRSKLGIEEKTRKWRKQKSFGVLCSG